MIKKPALANTDEYTNRLILENKAHDLGEQWRRSLTGPNSGFYPPVHILYSERKTFREYSFEEQASIIEDAYRVLVQDVDPLHNSYILGALAVQNEISIAGLDAIPKTLKITISLYDVDFEAGVLAVLEPVGFTFNGIISVRGTMVQRCVSLSTGL